MFLKSEKKRKIRILEHCLAQWRSCSVEKKMNYPPQDYKTVLCQIV